ncbi:hypothetical protein A2Z33_04830 [Candidatus Gottesmanbacteria bacterium RBG_16_52_11]|uniref:Phage holin family protein n=1 Tax=Candidatus Gottesmanbacteria bacterium RBG_16_52_11 TaxID=1798374 RepID=A0A1F5YUM5_9BACT|nr:MAG: hypothetical protein A2Z33_04830 [Candidatus Gottesmanbacteria bacterium RBG_16_52_11]
MKILANWLLDSLMLLVISLILPGFQIRSLAAALFAVIGIGLVNTLIKPLVLLVTLPLTFLTFGLFIFVINALMFLIVSRIVPGFDIDSVWTAVLGALLYSLLTSLYRR